MSDLYYRDRKGTLIDLLQWAALWADRSYRFLGDDTVGTTRVVTIWNGMYPYNADPVGPIFSSMVFRKGAGRFAAPSLAGALALEPAPGVEYGVEEWHETEAEALAWHAATVATLRGAAS